MGTFDTIILSIYTVLLAIISGIIVLAALGWKVPFEFIEDSLNSTNGRWVVGLSALAFFSVSVRLIISALSPRGGGKEVVHETAMGDVHISLDAVESLIRRVARSVKGVREMKASVTQAPGGLVADLRGVISPEVSIPEVSEEIQNSAKSYVRRVVGVEVAEVRLHVENISNEQRRSRLE